MVFTYYMIGLVKFYLLRVKFFFKAIPFAVRRYF